MLKKSVGSFGNLELRDKIFFLVCTELFPDGNRRPGLIWGIFLVFLFFWLFPIYTTVICQGFFFSLSLERIKIFVTISKAISLVKTIIILLHSHSACRMFKDTANLWRNNSYMNRQKMCKIMRGFHARAITINRAIGYISSGDHKKWTI